MTSVADHYARHLAPIYAWMVGDPDAAAERARGEVADLAAPHDSGAAVDLGAGLGFHALALAEAGYSVTALDTSPQLLRGLRERTGSLPADTPPVRAVVADVLMFRNHVDGPLDVVLCMGDTLTHLPGRAAVEVLANEAIAALSPGGVFCATFRDYTAPLEGDARFIPVRSDEQRTLTAFLEYDSDVVNVHDLVHERGPDGWALHVSSYPKLRLDPSWVGALFEEHGAHVERGAGPGGMVRLVARRG